MDLGLAIILEERFESYLIEMIKSVKANNTAYQDCFQNHGKIHALLESISINSLGL